VETRPSTSGRRRQTWTPRRTPTQASLVVSASVPLLHPPARRLEQAAPEASALPQRTRYLDERRARRGQVLTLITLPVGIALCVWLVAVEGSPKAGGPPHRCAQRRLHPRPGPPPGRSSVEERAAALRGRTRCRTHAPLHVQALRSRPGSTGGAPVAPSGKGHRLLGAADDRRTLQGRPATAVDSAG
jgi:hypothetical protein